MRRTLTPRPDAYEFTFPSLRDPNGLPVGGKIDLRVAADAAGQQVAVLDVYLTDGQVLVRGPGEQPRDPWVTEDAPIPAVVAAASEKFWAEVARLTPSATSGDFGSAEVDALEAAMRAAVALWRKWNCPPPTE